MQYVIVGNGVSGIRAAEAIRELDTSGAITMIADEKCPPYCRPMISLVLEGSVTPDNLPIRKDSFYDDLNITPMLGRRITGIDVDKKCVLVPKDNGSPQQITYDKLLIATGADPRPIRAEHADLGHIFFMRNQDHIHGMLTALPKVKNALVLGGGLVGFKAAYGLLCRGIQATMLIRSGHPLSMQADEEAGKMILDTLVGKGLTVKVGIEAVAFEGNGDVESAQLSDGTRIPCDMVVIGKGVLPALSFLPRDTIRTDLGIVINAHMQTNVADIYAAGDVAEFTDIARQSPWVNAIWPEAVIQGRIAGMNMAGRQVPYRGSLSRNVIRIFDLDIMTGGVVNPPDDAEHEVMIRKDLKRNTYRKLVFRQDILVGMVMVNHIEQGGLLLSMMQSRKPVRMSKEDLLVSSLNYKKVMV